MTHIEFAAYSNYHIRFKLKDGTELSGVLVNTINRLETNLPHTVYAFTPTKNMIEWKLAEQKKDTEKIRSLESQIDIANIIWAERI